MSSGTVELRPAQSKLCRMDVGTGIVGKATMETGVVGRVVDDGMYRDSEIAGNANGQGDKRDRLQRSRTDGREMEAEVEWAISAGGVSETAKQRGERKCSEGKRRAAAVSSTS